MTTTTTTTVAPKSSTLHFALTTMSDSMPKCFLRTSRLGSPYWGVLVSFCFGLLAFLSISSGSDQAFTWLSNLSGGWAGPYSTSSVRVCYFPVSALLLSPKIRVQCTSSQVPCYPSSMSLSHAHSPSACPLAHPIRPTRRVPGRSPAGVCPLPLVPSPYRPCL